jgi:hypothetical protein
LTLISLITDLSGGFLPSRIEINKSVLVIPQALPVTTKASAPTSTGEIGMLGINHYLQVAAQIYIGFANGIGDVEWIRIYLAI